MSASQRREAIAERLAAGGLVKICGLRETRHAVVAAEAGADLIGFVFAPARRRITPEDARDAIAAARAVAGRIVAVGVFVNAGADEIAEVAAVAGIDLAQLHGEEDPGLPAMLPVPATKAFAPPPGLSLREALAEIDRHLQAVTPPLAALVDGYHPGASGGTGARADWELAAGLAACRPLVLAGGLGPDNVADAIAAVRPLGVDVSSGVESDGIKDEALIRAFVRSAREAFRREQAARS
ncbi:MAG: phosphoribosylanthranilate isomerase [Chloroflexota bacterium]